MPFSWSSISRISLEIFEAGDMKEKFLSNILTPVIFTLGFEFPKARCQCFGTTVLAARAWNRQSALMLWYSTFPKYRISCQYSEILLKQWPKNGFLTIPSASQRYGAEVKMNRKLFYFCFVEMSNYSSLVHSCEKMAKYSSCRECMLSSKNK